MAINTRSIDSSALRTLRILGGPAHLQTVSVPASQNIHEVRVDVPQPVSSVRRAGLTRSSAYVRYVKRLLSIESESGVGGYSETAFVAPNLSDDQARTLIINSGLLPMKMPVIAAPFAEIEVDDSDVIARIGYAPKTCKLRIWFKTNSRTDDLSLYEYDEVGATVFALFLVAQSKGQFFNSQIKGSYSNRKVS